MSFFFEQLIMFLSPYIENHVPIFCCYKYRSMDNFFLLKINDRMINKIEKIIIFHEKDNQYDSLC